MNHMPKSTSVQIQDILNELQTHKEALDLAAIVTIADANGKITYVNDRLCEISKYSREELIGQDHRILNSGYHPKSYIKEMWDTILSGKVWRGEFRNRAKDESFYWVDSTIVPFKDGVGQVYQYLSIRYPITERKLAEEIMRDLVTGLAGRLGADFFPNLVVSLNRALSMRYTMVARFTGSDCRHMKSIAEATDGTLGEGFEQDIAGTPYENLLMSDTEFIPRNVAGLFPGVEQMKRLKAQSFVGQLLIDSRKQPLGILAIIDDKPIDERRLVVILNLLRIFSARATAEFERQQADELLHAQSSAIATSERMAALGIMAGSIAHEINNPLAILSGKATVLKERILDGENNPDILTADCDKIIAMATRIADIVRGLKTVSRDGTSDPFSPTPVSDIIRDVATLVSGKFKSARVELRLGDQAASVMIACRPVQISQVLVNLLSNSIDAVEAMDERWVKLEARSSEKSVKIAVIDSGGGISEEVASRIMQPFFTTKGVGKGTGLGLSISRKIIEAHGGSLTLRRDLPNTCFEIDLPVVQPLSKPTADNSQTSVAIAKLA